MTVASGNGNVYVVQGHLTKLACDAWLMPADGGDYVEGYWLHRGPTGIRSEHGTEIAASHLGARRGLTRKFESWTRNGDLPQPWVTDVVTHVLSDRPWDQPLRDFVAAAADGSASHGRSRRLLGVPLIGTGRSGTPLLPGVICEGVLATLAELAPAFGVDIALVLRDPDYYSAAQAVRRRGQGSWWSALDSAGAENGKSLLELAIDLGRLAATGDLVLFLGAGIALRAGAPRWSVLLERLALMAGMGEQEAAALFESSLGNLERAAVIDAYLAAHGDSSVPPIDRRNELVKQLTRSDHHALVHALLASLPIREVATTNYDEMFELASEAAGRPVARLPYESTRGRDRWVLKLHGSIDQDPPDLVLSRADYLRHAQQRSALDGLVQALLITRHLLFVGYSLDDDTFHRIAFDVRQALGDRPEPEPFGTALMVNLHSPLASIWKDDVDMVNLGAGSEAGDLLELFLDCVACHATTTAQHLFDPRLEPLLTDPEVELKAGLARLMEDIDVDTLDPAVAAPIRRALDAYGWREYGSENCRLSEKLIDERLDRCG